jgi:hypothetical protein
METIAAALRRSVEEIGMNDYIYNTHGHAVGFQKGDLIYNLNGHAVGQLQGTHVFGLEGHYVGELDDRMILDKGQNPGSAGSRGGGGAGSRGGCSRSPRNAGYPDVSGKLFSK